MKSVDEWRIRVPPRFSHSIPILDSTSFLIYMPFFALHIKSAPITAYPPSLSKYVQGVPERFHPGKFLKHPVESARHQLVHG